MTLYEKKAAKQAELLELKEAIEAGDEDAIAKGDEIASALAELEESIAALERAQAALESVGTPEEEDETPMEDAKSLGEFAVKNLDFTAIKSGMSKSAGTQFGFKAATDAHTSVPVYVNDTNIVDIQRNLEIRSLFGAEQISGNALNYYVMGAKEGTAPASVAENAQKGQFHISYEPKTASLQKIAGWFYDTDELIEDNAYLKSAIDNRGLYELDTAIESYLLTTLLGTSGIQTTSQAPSADNIFGAMMKVKTATGYNADAIVINPTDYETLRLAKDGGTTGQYYGGGYFYAPYGNGNVAQQPGLWGLNTVVTPSVAAGTVLVGAFGQGAAVITKAGEGSRIEVVTGDHDDRTNNRVTVIVEERLALAVRVPSAFVKVSA